MNFIGKYEVVSTLGRGSMGVVYKARDPEIGRVVAIKTLRSVFLGANDEGNEALERFKQESRSAGRLHHPNIVTIFEAGRTEESSPFIVMEFIEGESIEALLAEGGSFDPRVALHCLAQVASALDYAHSQNVLHRDIKPGNIVIDASNNPHLMDFGVAKLGDTSLTPAGTVVGTPSYMSPEQIRGEKLDGATDLFSFGVVAFELFTGKRPFPGKDFTTVVNNILHKQPRRFADVGCNLPDALEDVLHKAVAKNREERFRSALDFVSQAADVFQLVVDGTGIPGGLSVEKVEKKESAAEPLISPTVKATASPVVNNLGYGADGVQEKPQAKMLDAEGLTINEKAINVTKGKGQSAKDSEPELASGLQESLKTVSKPRGNKEKTEKRSRSGFVFAVGTLLVGVCLLVVLYVVSGDLDLFSPSSEKSSLFGSEATDGGSEPASGVQPDPLAAASEQIVVVEPQVAEPVAGGVGDEAGKFVFGTLVAVKPSGELSELVAEDLIYFTEEELAYLVSSGDVKIDLVKSAVVEASGRESENMTALLVYCVKHKDFHVRIAAVKGLGGAYHRDRLQAVEALKLALNDSEYLVRGFAVKVLVKNGGEQVLAALEQRLAVEDNEIVIKLLKQATSGLKIKDIS